VVATRLGELTVVPDGASLTGLYLPRHWPRPDRATFGARTGGLDRKRALLEIEQGG